MTRLSWGKPIVLATALALLGLAPPAAAGTAGPAVLPAPLTSAARVSAIARRLLLANAERCPVRRSDFGLESAPATPTSWGAAITRVWPEGAAAQAGLRAGDLIRSVNAVPWSADRSERERFDQALAVADQAGRLALVVERDGARRTIELAGQPRCHATVRLSADNAMNAAAEGSTIVIGSGLARLLPDDAELSFAIAHEAAHVALGHTAPERRAEIADHERRFALEQEADAVAVTMMAAAGYAADAAPAAWLKIADASRPPLIRLMDLHGPYMSTAERTAFLSAAATRLAVPPGTRLLSGRLAR